jgi:3-oxocholest-4-en-26-oate---CoA ligase
VTYNLADLFEGVVDAVPDREALVIGREGAVVQRLTYAELDRRVNATAALLAGAGVGPGDHVGLHLRNGAPFVEVMLAAFKLRAAPVNVNHRYVTAELEELIGDLDLRVVITEPDLAERLAPLTDLGAAPVVLVTDDTWDERVGAQSTGRPVVPGRSGDDRYVLCTGGTTGRPKGVLWRHEDLFFASLGGRGAPRRGVPSLDDPAAIGERARRGLPPDRRLPLCPLVHGAAQWVLLQALLGGGTGILSADRHFSAAEALSLADSARAELLMVVGDATAGPLADALAAEPGRWDLPALQMVSSSGAILAPAVQRRLAEVLPGVKVLDTFGASETGGQGRLAPAGDGGDRRPRLFADPHNAVLDDEGRRIEPGAPEVGRLARSGHIPLGYYKDPVKTAATFITVDGVRWSVPGDLARVEADGTITVLGRGSVCINTGGEKVHPEEVEAVLKAHPGVADAVVVGVPDDRFGSRVAAVVARRPGVSAGVDEDRYASVLEAHVRDRLSGYKVPRSWAFVDACQRLVSGKPDYPWARQVVTGESAAGSISR